MLYIDFVTLLYTYKWTQCRAYFRLNYHIKPNMVSILFHISCSLIWQFECNSGWSTWGSSLWGFRLQALTCKLALACCSEVDPRQANGCLSQSVFALTLFWVWWREARNAPTLCAVGRSGMTVLGASPTLFRDPRACSGVLLAVMIQGKQERISGSVIADWEWWWTVGSWGMDGW